MAPNGLQTHEFQPHPKRLQAQSVAGPSSRGLSSKNRNPSACKECRRRKQKCSLTHPCTNCARRFPQPACEYGVAKVKKTSPWVTPPGSKDGGPRCASSGLYSHLDLDSIHDAIIDVEGEHDQEVAVDNVSATLSQVMRSTCRFARRKQLVYSLKDELAGDKSLAIKIRDKTGLLKDWSLIELVQVILQTRLRVANRIVQDEWEIDGKQLVRALHTWSQPSYNISSLEDQMQRLPMEPTKMNKELVRTHLQLLSRFKASLNGSPRPNNRLMKHWIPFSIQDRLVLHAILCSTASFLHETGRLPKALMLIHRANVTSMLNEYISSPTLGISDSAILAVYQLILTAWYWSSTEELHAHMAGLKKMIELRGGCQNLGMEGYMSKIVLVDDIAIALCHDTEPLMFGQPGFVFEDPFRVPLQVCFNSPLLFNCPPFLIPSSSLKLHKATAEILDNTRTLFRAVVELSDEYTDMRCRTVNELASSLLCYLHQLPEQVLLGAGAGCDSFAVSAGQKRKRDEINEPATSSRTSRDGGLSSDISVAEEAPDLVYICVRLTALIWAKAIFGRVPTSGVCTEAEFTRIWSYAWTVGLDRWSTLSGIYAWMNIAIAPRCHSTIHARMVKSMTVTNLTYMCTENWHVATDIATVALKIQAWLRAGKESKPYGSVSGAIGGQQAIEDFGFAFRENDLDLPDLHDEQQENGEADEVF